MTHRYDSTKVWLDVPVSTVRTAEEGQTVPSDEAPTADMSARIVNTSPNLPNPEDWGSAPALDSLDFGTNATYGHHATSTGLSDLSSVPHNFYGQSPSHPYYVQPGGHYGRGGYYESQADALDDGTNYEDLRRSSEQYSYGRTQVPSLADTAPERQYLSRTHVDPAPRSSLPWGFSSNMATAVPNETHPCIEPVSGPHADYNSNSWEAHMNHPSMYEASNDGTFEETSPPLHSPLPRLRSQSEQQSIGSSQQPNEISLSVQGKAKQPWYKPDAMASEVQQTILEAHSQGPTSDRARLELTRKAFKGRMDKFVNKTRDLFRGEDDTRHELRGMTTSELHFTVADKWILANKDTEIRSIVDENCVEIAEDNGVTILRAKTGVDYVPQSYAIHDGPGALSQVITRPILVCESNSENYWVKLTAARDLASVQQGYLPVIKCSHQFPPDLSASNRPLSHFDPSDRCMHPAAQMRARRRHFDGECCPHNNMYNARNAAQRRKDRTRKDRKGTTRSSSSTGVLSDRVKKRPSARPNRSTVAESVPLPTHE